MLNTFLMSGIAMIIATGPIVAAQAPAPPSQQPAPGSQPATAQLPATITLIGCLVREQDVPGRKPNIPERADILEDYILTSAAPADQLSGSAATRGATGTSGSLASPHISSMYKVEGIPDERLKSLVGKKVEVTGRVDEDDVRETTGTVGSATPRKPGDDMPEFEATAIREVPGSCTVALEP